MVFLYLPLGILGKTCNKSFIMKTLTIVASFAAATFALAGCSAPNQVTRLVPDGAVVDIHPDGPYQGRYRNLYRGEREYPVTCEDNCYPEHPLVECDTTTAQCQYRGEQLAPLLETGFQVRWLGHASFVVHTPDGQQLLFDPVSQQFDWPVNWAFRLASGFNRQTPQWLSEQELQQTRAVFYSHLHYDHFNKTDIRRIGNDAHYFTPLDTAKSFPKGGFQITEMAWYASTQLDQLTIHAVPAHHFSSRVWVPFIYDDEFKSLWSGWLLEQNGKKLFFAGDTGYSEHFRDIQQRYGDIDICLLPVASYHHETQGIWYRYVHTTPEDALVAAQELNCKVMIPWGYGNTSWQMGDHSSHSPLLRLLHMQQQLNSAVPLLILNEGEQVSL